MKKACFDLELFTDNRKMILNNNDNKMTSQQGEKNPRQMNDKDMT